MPAEKLLRGFVKRVCLGRTATCPSSLPSGRSTPVPLPAAPAHGVLKTAAQGAAPASAASRARHPRATAMMEMETEMALTSEPAAPQTADGAAQRTPRVAFQC